MTIHVLEREMFAPVSLQDAFSIFENPNNLALITPPWLNFRILTPDVVMREGALIDYTIRWLGLPMRWRTLISRYQPPYEFVDEQLRGPYRLWRHRHTFQAVNRGVLARDRVEYALPLPPLGELAHALVVRRQIEQIFDYRERKLSELFAALPAASERQSRSRA